MSSRPTLRQLRPSNGPHVLLSAFIWLAVVVGGLIAAPAFAAGPPIIENVASSTGGRITVSVTIDPEGLETASEIKLSCATCGPPGYAPAVGRLPAIYEARTTTLDLTGIQPGTYGFEVIAHNAAGAVKLQDELTVPASGGCPQACPVEPHESELSQGFLEASRQWAEGAPERERERQAVKEREERQAIEAAARQDGDTAALERDHEEERAALAERRTAERREAEERAPCVVPALRGDTLASARSALAKAHCRLGRVTRLHGHGDRRVVRQGARPGKRLPHGARVALSLDGKTQR